MPAPDPNYQKLSTEEERRFHAGRAENRRKALEIASKDIAHLESIVFTPCRFVVQRHWWGEKSVADYTPVIVRQNGLIRVIQIRDLWNQSWTQEEQSLKDIEVWTKHGWEKVKTIYRHRLNKTKLMRVNAYGGVVDVTENHSLFQNGHAIEASLLSSGSLVDLIALPIIDGKQSVDKDYAWLLGFFLAEGYVKDGRNGGAESAVIGTTNEKYLSRILAFCRRYGIEASFSVEEKGLDYKILYRIQLSVLSGVFRKFYGRKSIHTTRPCYSKKIPEFVFDFDRKSLSSFLNGFLDGDGLNSSRRSKTSDRDLDFASTSAALAQGIILIVSTLNPGLETSVEFNESLYRVHFIVAKHNRAKPRGEIRRLAQFAKADIYGENNPNYRHGERILKISTQRLFYSTDRYVYDIETETHSFSAGVGRILAHNSHYDVRVQKLGSTTWFGFTLFTSPFSVNGKRAAQGTVKGYEQLVVPKHEGRPKMESLGEMRWMDFEGKMPVGAPGNPTKNFIAYMVIEDKGYAILHRRELDFIDLSFLGRKIRGRYFYRLVPKLASEEKGSNSFYFRRAKEERQIDLNLLGRVITKRLTLADKKRLFEVSENEKRRLRSKESK